MVDLRTTLSGDLDEALPFPGAETGPFREPKDVASTLGGIALDVTPIIGDVRNVQAGVQAFEEGDKLGMGLAALGAIPGVGLLFRGGRSGFKTAAKIFKASDIPGSVARAIPIEQEVAQFSHILREMGAAEDVTKEVTSLVGMGMQKAEKTGDPAFVDAVETMMETSRALNEGPLKSFPELAEKTLEKLAGAKRIIRSAGDVPTKARGSILPTRHSIDVMQDGSVAFQDSAVFPSKVGAINNQLDINYMPAFEDDMFELVFTMNGSTDLKLAAQEVKASDKVRVLGTVFFSAERFLKREAPGMLSFTAEDPARAAAYRAMGPRLKKSTGYNFTSDVPKNISQDNPAFFVMTDPAKFRSKRVNPKQPIQHVRTE